MVFCVTINVQYFKFMAVFYRLLPLHELETGTTCSTDPPSHTKTLGKKLETNPLEKDTLNP